MAVRNHGGGPYRFVEAGGYESEKPVNYHIRIGSVLLATIVAGNCALFVATRKSDARLASVAFATSVATDLTTAARSGEEVEGWGAIKGQVVYEGELSPAKVLVRKGDQLAKDAPRCGAVEVRSEELVVNPKNRGVKWSVVYLLKPTKVHPDLQKVPVRPAKLSQEFCVFKPHVLAFREGQKLKITAGDPGVAHNTKIVGFRNQGFNKILRPPAVEGEQSEMDGPDLVAERLNLLVECNIHPWMSAKFWVFDHPYFAVTGEDGTFEFRNVPIGIQRLVVWQEKHLFKNERIPPDDRRKGRNGFEINVKPGESKNLGRIKIGS